MKHQYRVLGLLALLSIITYLWLWLKVDPAHQLFEEPGPLSAAAELAV